MSTVFAEERGTNSSLLRTIKSLSNARGWTAFYETYGPLVDRFAAKFGLSFAEREDVVQNTMVQVVKKIPTFEYDRERGSFKAWLFKSAKWRILDIIRDRPKNTFDFDRGPRGDEDAAPRAWEPSVSVFERIWDQEWEGQLLRDALEEVRKKVSGVHFQIFCLNVLEDLPARRVAEMVGVRTAQVHLVKCRLGRMIKKQLAQLRKQQDDHSLE